MFDKNGDGEISVAELGEAMKQAGQELSEEELKDMIRAVDRNGNNDSYFFTLGRIPLFLHARNK